MPRGSDESFFRKLCSALKAHAHFGMPAPAAGRGGGIFVIKHYAGDVAYSPSGLLDKNKDQLYRDLIELSGASRFELISSLFPEAGEKAGTQKRPVTAGSQFRTQIGELVARLNECEHGQSDPLGSAPASAAPAPPQGAPGGPVQLGTPRVSPGHWEPQPRPQLLERAACKVAPFTAFVHPGVRAALHPVHQIQRQEAGGAVRRRAHAPPGAVPWLA